MELAGIFSQLGGGMIVSVEIFILTLLFSLPLGLVIAFGRMSKNIVLSSIVKIYIAIMRGTPLMLQLIVVYFAPYYVFGMKISQGYRFVATIIAFSINFSSMFMVSGRMSTKVTVAPRKTKAFAVETKVYEGMMTSSPGDMSHKIADISRALVQDVVRRAFFVFVFFCYLIIIIFIGICSCLCLYGICRVSFNCV